MGYKYATYISLCDNEVVSKSESDETIIIGLGEKRVVQTHRLEKQSGNYELWTIVHDPGGNGERIVVCQSDLDVPYIWRSWNDEAKNMLVWLSEKDAAMFARNNGMNCIVYPAGAFGPVSETGFIYAPYIPWAIIDSEEKLIEVFGQPQTTSKIEDSIYSALPGVILYPEVETLPSNDINLGEEEVSVDIDWKRERMEASKLRTTEEKPCLLPTFGLTTIQPEDLPSVASTGLG